MIAGVDGYLGGWIAAIADTNSQTSVEVFSSFSMLLQRDDLKIIVIDIPIGLTDGGPRTCDLEARKFIGARRSSVFPAPIRPMLAARSYDEACGIRLRIDGKKCSKQLWAITPKIRDVDAHISPSLQERVYEGHPEVSFACMNGHEPLRHSKHTEEGRKQRLILLEKNFPNVEKQLHLHVLLHAESDILDAHACLWTARRLLTGKALRFPDKPQFDMRGLRTEMVC